MVPLLMNRIAIVVDMKWNCICVIIVVLKCLSLWGCGFIGTYVAHLKFVSYGKFVIFRKCISMVILVVSFLHFTRC